MTQSHKNKNWPTNALQLGKKIGGCLVTEMLYLFICILHLAIEDVAAANYFLLVDDVAHSTSGEPEVSFQWGTQLLNSAGCYILVIVL